VCTVNRKFAPLRRKSLPFAAIDGPRGMGWGAPIAGVHLPVAIGDNFLRPASCAMAGGDRLPSPIGTAGGKLVFVLSISAFLISQSPLNMLDVSYTPQDLERKWYAKWMEKDIFKGRISSEKMAYAIAIPPPNVTGILHMGHILNNTIHDVLIRRARQNNRSAFWIPGTDHAGISLQIKVEKELAKQNKTRMDVGRQTFGKMAEEWRERHGGIILDQLKKLGVSCDWSAIHYT
jgi:hypothetical protein